MPARVVKVKAGIRLAPGFQDAYEGAAFDLRHEEGFGKAGEAQAIDRGVPEHGGIVDSERSIDIDLNRSIRPSKTPAVELAGC